MDTTLYVSLSHQAAMRRNLDLVANNIANMNTTAYRREQVMFKDYVVELENLDSEPLSEVSFVQDYGVARDFSQGAMQPTGNPLDVAISGKGFFEVTDPETDETRYTRNGHLKISDAGYLVTANGKELLSVEGSPIKVETNTGVINVAGDGTVSAGATVFGRLKVVNFENEQLLRKVGDTLFSSTEEPIDAENIEIRSGMIEGSNVQPLVEMTEMMKIMRRYQSVNGLTDKYQEMRSRSIENLGRVQ